MNKVSLRSSGMIEVMNKEQMKMIMGGTEGELPGDDGGIPKCNSCSVSHPGYTCAKQTLKSGDEFCMCGEVSNYWYC